MYPFFKEFRMIYVHGLVLNLCFQLLLCIAAVIRILNDRWLQSVTKILKGTIYIFGGFPVNQQCKTSILQKISIFIHVCIILLSCLYACISHNMTINQISHLSFPAVTWLKYCRYGVKLYPINHSIKAPVVRRSAGGLSLLGGRNDQQITHQI